MVGLILPEATYLIHIIFYRKCKYLDNTEDADDVEEMCCDSNEVCRAMKESAEKNGVTETTDRFKNCPDLCPILGWTDVSSHCEIFLFHTTITNRMLKPTLALIFNEYQKMRGLGASPRAMLLSL